MRWKLACLCLGATLLLCGCSMWPFKQTSQERIPPLSQKPTPGQLISYLNTQADAIGSIRVDDLEMEAQVGALLSMGMQGKLVCQKPRNFRLEAYGASRSLEADVGSNDSELWFYLARNEPPYLFHCRHDELYRAPPSFPFQPDWVLEALGMGHIDSPERFHVEIPPHGSTIELVEQTRTPQGQPVKKITVFDARDVFSKEPHVIGRKLVDANGAVLASARIIAMQQDQQSGIAIPHQIELTSPLPGERLVKRDLRLKLTLDNPVVNGPMEPGYVAMKFTRPSFQGVQTVDLARANYANSTSNNSDNRPALFRGLRKQ